MSDGYATGYTRPRPPGVGHGGREGRQLAEADLDSAADDEPGDGCMTGRTLTDRITGAELTLKTASSVTVPALRDNGAGYHGSRSPPTGVAEPLDAKNA